MFTVFRLECDGKHFWVIATGFADCFAEWRIIVADYSYRLIVASVEQFR